MNLSAKNYLSYNNRTQLNQKSQIPKIIWIFWAQGYDNAPTTVKKCVESWHKYNKDWEIRFVDNYNLPQYLPNLSRTCANNIDFIQNRKPLYADLIRLNLLKEYGGLWIDSTCFCCMPLDQWFDQYRGNDLFVFSGNKKGMMLENWFIGAPPDSYLLHRWCDEFNSFFVKYGVYKSYWHEFYRYHDNLIQEQRFKSLRILALKINNKLREILLKVVEGNNNSLTPILLITDPLIRLKYVPYFASHYCFSKIVYFEKRCRDIWNDIPKENGRKSTDIGSKLFQIPIDPNIKEHIDQRKSPLYKLSHKLDKKHSESENLEKTTLYYLFDVHLK